MDVWAAIGLGGALVATVGFVVMAQQAHAGKLKLQPWAHRGRAARILLSPYWWLACAAFSAASALRFV